MVFGLDSDYDTGRRVWLCIYMQYLSVSHAISKLTKLKFFFKLAWGFVNKTGMEDLPKVIVNGVPLEQKKVRFCLFFCTSIFFF